MAHRIENRIVEASTSTGTGPVVLTPVASARRFSSAMAIGDTCWYLIEALDASGAVVAFEYGRGSYSAANTIARNTVIGSSNGGASVNFPAGSKRVSMTALAPTADTAAEWRSAIGLDELIRILLPDGASPGQALFVNATGTGLVARDIGDSGTVAGDYADSIAAVNASRTNMTTKMALFKD